jgi:hypothetical protein
LARWPAHMLHLGAHIIDIVGNSHTKNMLDALLRKNPSRGFSPNISFL